jgi:hypothetical protein
MLLAFDKLPFIHPFRRGFFCGDQDIMFPYKEVSFRSGYVALISAPPAILTVSSLVTLWDPLDTNILKLQRYRRKRENELFQFFIFDYRFSLPSFSGIVADLKFHSTSDCVIRWLALWYLDYLCALSSSRSLNYVWEVFVHIFWQFVNQT